MPNLNQWNKNNILKFTIDNTKIEEDLTDFPLLLNITQTSGLTGYDCSNFFNELSYPNFNTVTFSGTNYSQPDTNLWTVSSKEKVYIYNNTLTISGSTTEYCESKFSLSGNFDIQIDVDFTGAPYTNSWAGQLMVLWNFRTYINSVSIYKGFTSSSLKCVSDYLTNGSSGVISNVNNVTNPSKLRIVRASSTAYFYFWENSAWVAAGSYTISTTNVKIKIISGKWDNQPTAVVKFNNLIINEGTIVWPTTKHPNCKKIAAVYPGAQEHLTQRHDKYVSLLINSNTSNGSIIFIDDSIYKHNITSVGTAQHSSAQTVLNCVSSIFFNGSGNYLSIPYSPAFDFGVKDFTVDLWVYIPSSSTFVDNEIPLVIAGKQDTSSSGGGWNVHIFDTPTKTIRLERCFTNGTSSSYKWTLPSFSRDMWHHVAVCRSEGTAYCFYNGTSLGTTTYFNNIDISNSNNLELLIGTGRNGGSYSNWPLKGFLAEIRISKGIARWTQNFSLASAPYTKDNVAEAYTHSKQEQLYCEIENFDQINKSAQIWVKVPKILYNQPTDLLLYFDKTQPDNISYIGTIGDFAAQKVWDENFVAVYHMNQDPSPGGTFLLDSTATKNNSTSSSNLSLVSGKISNALNFGGSTLRIGNAVNMYSSVTHSVFFNTTSLAGRQYITTIHANPPTSTTYTYQERQGLTIGNGSPYNKLVSQYYITTSSPAAIESTTVLQTNTWYHGAFSADSTGGKLYLNGGLEGTAAGVPIISTGVNDRLIGARVDPQGTDYFNGIIEEVRFSKTARSKAWLKAEYYTGIDNLCTVSSGTLYFIAGYVKEGETPIQRTVYLYDRASGALMDSCVSNASTGYYLLRTTASGMHNIVCIDDTAGNNYDDIMISKATPMEVI